MRTIRTLGAALALVALGYVVGASGGLRSLVTPVHAQENPEAAEGPDEVDKKIEAAILALDAATRAMIADKRYVPAIDGLNGFAVTAGGGDMIAALEAGRSVDPETYVGLYAGLAVPEIQDKLDKDEDGRLTYDGKVIRMYPIPELSKLYQARNVVAKDLVGRQSAPKANE